MDPGARSFSTGIRRLIFLAGLSAFLIAVLSAASDPPSSKSLVEDLRLRGAKRQDHVKALLHSYHFSEIADALADYAHDPNPEIRILMVQMLGEMGRLESVRHLQKLFRKEKDARVRKAILVQIAGILPDGQEKFMFFRKAALKDPDSGLRFLSLSELSLLRGPQEIHREIKRAFRKARKKDNVEKNRLLAAVVLAEMGEDIDKFGQEVLRALESQWVELRRRAARALVTLDVPGEYDRVVVAAQDPDGEVRLNVCRALGTSEKAGAIPVLKSLAADREPAVRLGALEALSQFSKEQVGIKPYLDALKDKDPAVRRGTIGILEKIGDSSATGAIGEASRNDEDLEVRRSAVRALKTLSGASP